MKKYLMLFVLCIVFSSCYKTYTCKIHENGVDRIEEKRFRTKGEMNKWCGENTTAFGSIVSYKVADCVPKE